MSPPTLEEILDPSVRHAVVERSVLRDWHTREQSSVRLAVAMRRLFRDNVHRGHGRGRFSDWARERFGIPEKLAWTFSLLGRDLERFPRIRAAMEEGTLGYTKVREFIREVTPENEAFWIEFAGSHTNREIEREVTRRRGREPGRVLKILLSAEEQQDLRRARERMARNGGPPASEADAVKALVRMAASGRAPAGLFEGCGSGVADRIPAPRPWLSLAVCASCLDSWIPVPGENLSVPFARWLDELRDGAEVVDLLGHFLCDCEVVRHRRDRCPNGAPPIGPPATSRHVPAAVRRIVEARDGFRCRTPGCTNPHPLEFSHLRGFAAGTPMSPEFLAQHCRACNDMIESGQLLVRGTAPFEEYRDAAGNLLGIGYDPRSRAPGVSHRGNGEDQVEWESEVNAPPPPEPPKRV